MSRILFIANPAAGRGRGEKAISHLQTLLQPDENLIITKYKGHATGIVKEQKGEFKIICAVGGDGTINEVINGFEPDSNLSFGILPCGSGNDFVKMLGLTKSFNNNLKIVRTGKFKLIDLPEVHCYEKDNVNPLKRYFINSLGIGFDALVADLIKNSERLKGLPLYLMSVIKALNIFQSFVADCEFDHDIIKTNSLLISVGNGKYSGGGFNLNPGAEIGDTLLDVCIIENLPKSKIIVKLPLAILGKHSRLPYCHFYKYRNAKIKLNSPSYIHIDGEVISKSITDVYINLEKKMKVIIA